MFPVFVNDGSQQMPDDDILYIVCKEGTYLKKKLGIMESITPVKTISVLKSIEMMATMHIKPIPGTLFAPVMDFFSKVYEEHRGEAIVLLFYNEEKRVYKIVPPSQEVSASGVDYNRAMTIDGYVMVGDIHSHANFSAFHSGTDDADEKSFDGLHITIGNNGSPDVSISASIVSNGQRFIVQPNDYINGIALTVDIDEVIEKPYSTIYQWDHTQKKLVPKESTKTYRVKRFDKRFQSTVSKKYQKCPDAWLALVSKKQWGTYRAIPGQYGGSTWNAQTRTWKNWDLDKFDANAWKDHARAIAPQGKPPLVPAAVKPITFPPHVQNAGPTEKILDDDFNPCTSCPFVHHKVDMLMDEMLNSDEADETQRICLDEDGHPIDWYQCDKCEHVFSVRDDAGNADCPNCNTDDHLILLDLEDLEKFDIPHTKAEVVDNEPATENYHFKCKECATETSILNHGQCPFCGGDVMDIIDADALRAAAEEDETMESIPLPVPDEDKIPLGTRKKQKRKPGIFARVFKKG
jgi:PRTRC genetic system protein A